jgi:mRNA interferase MazF
VPPLRGQVVLVDLEPAISPEQNKVRPCIIVSNDGANLAGSRTENAMVTVVPITRTLNTSGTPRPYQVEIEPEESGLGFTSTAQCEQIRSVSACRLVRIVGQLSFPARARLDAALRVQLAL